MTIESDARETFTEVNSVHKDREDGLVKDDEPRVNIIDENVKEREGDGTVRDGSGSFRENEFLVNRIQQETRGSVASWERFLHVPSVRVLLVENDDSTRHLLCALLHNNNYDVVEAADGLQAWRHLEDLSNHIDIVLTEIVMPGLSGIGLLCKIMCHNTRKDIPVIIMSSLDSMALVYKCLSKGAVDFLMKPIRKNELKNLWQHIWRRCHSSSGSWSESGAQTKKSVKLESDGKSDDNNSQNSSDYNENKDLKDCDGSETQSSWTSQDEVVSTNPEVSSHIWRPMTAKKESQEHEEPLENVAKSKELAISEPRNDLFQTRSPSEPNILLPLDSYRLNKIIMERSNSLEITIKSIDEPKEFPSTELSLKRVRGTDTSTQGETVQSDQNVSRRLDFSSFSRSEAKTD